MPLYEQLAAILRRQIASGELAAGRPIPSEQALMDSYGVSRGTAAHAEKPADLAGWRARLPTLKA